MENTNNIQIKAAEMIKDLIALDPSLKSLELELNTLVLELVKNKPESNLDPEFETALKLEVLKKVEELKTKEVKPALPFSWSVFIKKTSLSLAALVLTIIIVIPVTKQLGNKLRNTDTGMMISLLEDQAFGEISSFNKTNQKVSENVELFGQKEVSVGKRNESAGSVSVANPSIMPYLPDFDYPNFTYKYEGEDLKTILSGLDDVYVYRISPEVNINSSVLKSIVNSNTKLINLKNFQQPGLKLFSYSFSEENDFGYSINFDDGNIYLYQNWKYWPDITQDFKYEDLLSNEETINIAEDFVKEYGINRSAYGEAKINYDFHNIYTKDESIDMLYIPTETEVVFPLLIDNKEVMSGNGEPYGLSVTVSSSYKKVVSLNNLKANAYEASIYKAFTDANKIKEIVENGGLNNYQSIGDNKKNIEVRLGSPEIILSQQYYYNDKDQSNSEIFVPALSFPVLGLSEETDFFSQKSIIIPLLKDIIDNNNNGIIPMPRMIYETKVMN